MAGKKLFSSLFSSFLMVSLVPVVLLGYVATMVSSHTSMNEIKTQLSAASQGAASVVSSLISQFGANLTLFGEDPEVVAFLVGEPEQEQQVYRKMYFSLSGHGGTCAMHLVSIDGTRNLSTGSLPAEYNPLHFGSWGLLGNLACSDKVIVYPNMLGGKTVMSLGKTIKGNDGNIIGYAIIDVSEDSLKDVLSTGITTFPVSYGVYDTHGFIVYDNLGLKEDYPFVPSAGDIVGFSENGSIVQKEVHGRKVMISCSPLNDSDLLLVAGVPVDLVLENNRRMVVITLIFALCAVVLCLYSSFTFARGVSKPITQMGDVMGKVEKGDLSARCLRTRKDELGELAERLNAMIQNLDDLFRSNLEKQDLLRSAELRNLKAQIDPHFLYNTLDSVRYMIRLGMKKEAAMAISDLGILLKNGISNSKDICTLREELHVIDSYLEIVRLQHPDKILILKDVPDDIQECLLPKLLIQPIVENAVVHGLEGKMGGGKLEIIGRMRGDSLSFVIRDNGLGMSYERLREVLGESDETSIGIANVRKRLRLYYGEAARMTITSRLHEGTQVSMVIPIGVLNVPRVSD